MRTSNSLRWLVVVAGAAMLLAVAAACAGETVEVPGETVVVEKEVVRTVEVPGETVTVEVVKEVQVPGETVVVEKVVTETVEVPGETVVVEKEVVKTVEVPGETVVVTKEVAVPVEVVREVPSGKNYVTDTTTGKVVTAPQYGGTLTFAAKLEPPSTDPVLGIGGSRGVTGVAERLGIVNWGLDREEFDLSSLFHSLSEYKGHLAESWETPDDTTIVLNIRQGVHWHDKPPMNGRELTAKDIEYNFHRILGLGSGFTEPPAAYDGYLAANTIFESVTATDKWTVVIKLKEPKVGTLFAILDDPGAFILPPEVIKEHGDVKDWRNLVGTGTYMLTDWVDGSSMTWEKNPDYWGFDEKYPENRLPYVDQLRGLIIKEDATILAALRTGKFDYVGVIGGGTTINIPEAESLQRTNPEIELYPWASRSESAFTFNMGGGEERPPFNDVRVRHAMQMALDLETINITFFKGFAKWKPQGMIGVAIGGSPFEEWPEELKGYYTYDPEGAEKLLDEAGYPRGADGIRFKVDLEHYEFFLLDYTQIAADYWAEIGVDVEITVGERSAYIAHVRQHTYGDMTGTIAGLQYISPLASIAYFHSESTWNPPNLNDPEYDLLYEAARDATIEEGAAEGVARGRYVLDKEPHHIMGSYCSKV